MSRYERLLFTFVCECFAIFFAVRVGGLHGATRFDFSTGGDGFSSSSLSMRYRGLVEKGRV